MTDREAMKQALEALETERDKYMEWGDEDGAPEEVYDAITALRTAIEQAEKQEPVATVRTWHKNGDQHAELGDWELGLFKLPDGEHTLYTTPPAAQPAAPLTPERIRHLVDAHVGGPNPGYPLDNSDWLHFARAVEAAHGITGETK